MMENVEWHLMALRVNFTLQSYTRTIHSIVLLYLTNNWTS